MRVKFTKPYRFTPAEDRRVIIKYRPDGGPDEDGVYTVRRSCGEAAVGAGKAVEVIRKTEAGDTGES